MGTRSDTLKDFCWYPRDANGLPWFPMEGSGIGKTKSIYFRDEELLAWVEDKVEEGTFRNPSHAVERALKELRDDPLEL